MLTPLADASRWVDAGILCCEIIFLFKVLLAVPIELEREPIKMSFTSLVKLFTLTIVFSWVEGANGVYTPVTPLLFC